MKNSGVVLLILISCVFGSCQKEEFLVSEKQEEKKTDLKFDSKTKDAKKLIAKDWSKVANLKPRHSHTSLVFDDKIWIIGGKGNGKVPKKDVLYSKDGKSWKPATQMAPFEARFEHASTVFNGKLWVVGGLRYNPNIVIVSNAEDHYMDTIYYGNFLFAGEYSAMNDVWSSSDGIEWVRITANADFPPRFAHTVTAFDGALWVIGGRSDDWAELVQPNYRDIWRSYDGKDWVKVTDQAAFTQISRHTALAFKNSLWIVGDAHSGPYGTWSSKNGKEWHFFGYDEDFYGKVHHAMAEDNENMWVVGSNGFTDNICCSYPESDIWYGNDGLNWTEAKIEGAFKKRWAHSSVFFKDKLWVINGWGRSSETKEEFEAFSDIWSFEESNTIDDITSKSN